MSRLSRFALSISLLILVVFPPVLSAQSLAARPVAAGADVTVEKPERLDLLVGHSAVLRLDRPITRVSLSTPDIADALATSPYELLVHGKAPGSISLFVWSDRGIKTYDVAVKRDLSALEEQVRTLFPGEPIVVASNGKDVVLSGIVSTKFIAERAASLAVGYVDKQENVVNLLRQREGEATNQVMLQVRFAEVNRSALQELGTSFFTGPNGHGDWTGRSTTEQFGAPDFDKDKGLVFSDFLNIFLYNSKENIGTLIKALQNKGLFQSLAEPNLITQDGKEAYFLAGGEYPYPVVQAQGGASTVTIVFKEFGIRLRFTPTILNDATIHLKVAPEVSTLDFNNAIVLDGFRIPALSTRKTDTEVELRDGQTFAIAGLLDNGLNETLSRVPGIGDIPVLGYLFRSRAYQKHSTELVVMITPRIVHRNSPGVTPSLPGLVQPYLPPVKRVPSPPPAFSETQTQVQEAAPVAPVAPQAAAVAPAPPATHTGSGDALASPKPTKAQLDALNKARAQDAERQKQQRKTEADQAKKDAEQQKRAADQAKKDAAAAAKAAEAQKKKDAADAERAKAEAARSAAELQKKTERDQVIAAELAKAEARQKAEQAKLDQEHQEEERKLAEKRRLAEEKLAKERQEQITRVMEQYSSR